MSCDLVSFRDFLKVVGLFKIVFAIFILCYVFVSLRLLVISLGSLWFKGSSWGLGVRICDFEFPSRSAV